MKKALLKSSLILIIILLPFSCNSDDQLTQIINDLHNQNDTIRFNAVGLIKEIDLDFEQQFFVLKEAAKEFPPAEFELGSIPNTMIEAATKNEDIRLIAVLKENFKDYDKFAKAQTLYFLSGFDNMESIQAYTELLMQYSPEIEYLPVGILDKNYSYKKVIFPKLLELIDFEAFNSDILLLFFHYLEAHQLCAKDYINYLDKILVLSEKYRAVLDERIKLDVDRWGDEEYQNARYEAGIIADLLGYFDDKKALAELYEYLQLDDKKLKLFAVVSLLQHGITTDTEMFTSIAADPECRNWLYDNLVSMNKAELFPEEYKTQEYFAESNMIDWLLYPTELGRIPDTMELMQIFEVDSESEDGIVEFYLYRFKSSYENDDEDEWMTGVSGYFPKKDKPSTSAYGYTFSQFEKWDSKTPDEHLQGIIDNIQGYYNKE